MSTKLCFARALWMVNASMEMNVASLMVKANFDFPSRWVLRNLARVYLWIRCIQDSIGEFPWSLKAIFFCCFPENLKNLLDPLYNQPSIQGRGSLNWWLILWVHFFSSTRSTKQRHVVTFFRTGLVRMAHVVHSYTNAVILIWKNRLRILEIA